MTTFKTSIDRTWDRRLTRRIDIGERQVLVFDRLFSPSTNALLYQFLRGQAFVWGGRDTNDAVHGHSIRWTLGIDRGAAKLGFFSEVIDLVNGAVSEPVNLLDIYANFNLYGEVHYAHADAARGVTALYC